MPKPINLFIAASIVVFIYPVLPTEIFGRPAKAIPFIFLALSYLFYIYKEGVKSLKKPLIILLTPFLIILLDHIFRNTLSLKQIETSLGLFVVPLIYSTMSHKILKSDVLKLFLGFVLASFTVVLMLFLSIAVENEVLMVSSSNKYRDLSKNLFWIKEHPIYTSFFFAVSIILIAPLRENKSISLKLAWTMVLLFLLGITILFSKGVILALTASSLFLYLGLKKRVSKRTVFIGAFIITVFALMTKDIAYGRSKEVFISNTYTEKLEPTRSSSIRFNIYRCSFSMFMEKPFLGYGNYRYKEKLNNCMQSPQDGMNLFNTHNQFLDYLVSTGLIGLLTFMFYIRHLYIKSYKSTVTRALIVFFASLMIFETIFHRQSGVLVYSMMISLLYSYNFNSKNENII